MLYFMKMNMKVKVFIGLLLVIVVLPVLGIRNIFYLEVIFQMAVFAALALGLNIVIGMAGLLDLGYVAFYAVGAYTWAIFGSKQLSLVTLDSRCCPCWCGIFACTQLFLVIPIPRGWSWPH